MKIWHAWYRFGNGTYGERVILPENSKHPNTFLDGCWHIAASSPPLPSKEAAVLWFDAWEKLGQDGTS